MKKRFLFKFLFLAIILFSTSLSCETSNETDCGTYNGHQLYKGSQGGCYYYNSNDNKTYVDRSYCNC